ncbi:MAG: exo-alpha-sialidase [Candidatus Bathyarchaeia archaeon]
MKKLYLVLLLIFFLPNSVYALDELTIQPIISRPGWDEYSSIAGNETHLIVTWDSDFSGNRDIWYSIHDGSMWGPPQQLTTDPNRDRYPYVTILKDGRILVLWTSNRSGQSELWYKVCRDGVWSPDRQLTTHPEDYDVYSPVIQLADGSIAVAWTSNTTSQWDVYFATFSLDTDGILNWKHFTRLTNANSTMWLYARSIIQTFDGKIWVLIYDLYYYDWEDHLGNITTIYYYVSEDGGYTWSGKIMSQGSGIANPAAVQLPNGTILVIFQGDDLERGILDTLWYMTYHMGVWSEPVILTPSKHLWGPSIIYRLGKLHITAIGWSGDINTDDIFLITISVPPPVSVGGTAFVISNQKFPTFLSSSVVIVVVVAIITILIKRR